jgi:hypothetical protein
VIYACSCGAGRKLLRIVRFGGSLKRISFGSPCIRPCSAASDLHDALAASGGEASRLQSAVEKRGIDMAKASKNTDKKASSSPAPKSGAKKAPKSTKSAKSNKPAAQTGAAPMIDTSLAAQNAARFLAAGFKSGAAGNSTAAQPESAMFKNLKAGVNKPASSGMSSLLDKSHGPEPVKSHPQNKQIGRNQTFGADVNRSGVPRRTPG